MAQKTFIGLSFGNHNSVIAIINKDQRAEVIANEEGEHKTPTYLAFSGDEEFHGSQAKHQIVRNAHSTVAGFRDMLGSGVTATAAGFAAVDAEGAFVVRTDGDRVIRVTAHEAAVRYVGRLRATAEAYVGRAIDGAVLAVPAWFTAAQRAAVGAACADAGLALLQVVTEPAAAAAQYGLASLARDAVAVVVDVGGSGADVTVIAAAGGLVAEVAHARTTAVSGDALDTVLVRHFAAEFHRAHGIDVLADARAERKLRQAVEATKRTLSSAASAPCAVESLAGGLDFSSSISRTRFDVLCARVFAPLEAAVADALAAAGYAPRHVDQVLLCGGAARVRRLQRAVAALFPEGTLVRDDAAEELDEVVAAGCAAQAALLARGLAAAPPAALHAHVLARPVGLRLGADVMVPVLPRHAPLPAARSVRVALPAAEARAYVAVAEGEANLDPELEDDEDDEEEQGEEEQAKAQAVPPRFRPARLLAELVLDLGAPAAHVDVAFFVAADRTLTVTATEPVSGKSVTAVVPFADH